MHVFSQCCERFVEAMSLILKGFEIVGRSVENEIMKNDHLKE